MKKIYATPNTKVITFEAQTLMAGSLTVNGSKEVNDVNDLLSRRRNMWDDEDEEE